MDQYKRIREGIIKWDRLSDSLSTFSHFSRDCATAHSVLFNYFFLLQMHSGHWHDKTQRDSQQVQVHPAGFWLHQQGPQRCGERSAHVNTTELGMHEYTGTVFNGKMEFLNLFIQVVLTSDAPVTHSNQTLFVWHLSYRLVQFKGLDRWLTSW